MRFRLRTLLILLAIGPACCVLFATENQADPVGTWTWRDSTLTLKPDRRGKLSGSLSLVGNFQWPIEGVVFNDGVLTFNRKYEHRLGGKVVLVFPGTLTGDTIFGTIEYRQPSGAVLTQKWEAKRSKTP